MPDPSQVVGIDPAAVTRWLDQLGVGFTGPLQFERIGLGQSNLTYLVRDADDRRWVLRRPPLGQLLASAHDVAREARIMAALAPTDVPLPQILGVAQDPAIADVPLVLMEFIDGQVVDTIEVTDRLPRNGAGRSGCRCRWRWPRFTRWTSRLSAYPTWPATSHTRVVSSS